MNNDEAKFLLNAYRPGGRDASDATFSTALEQARIDPALGAWFAREQAHGAAVAAKLREIAPPAGLREAILAGARASEGAAPRRARPKMRPVWIAAAAGLAVLVALGVGLWPKGSEAQQFTDFVVHDATHGRHGGHGAPTGALQAMLSQPTARLGRGLPVDFATLKSTGCRTLSVAGHDVLEVCFGRDGAEFHLYVVRREDFSGPVADDAPEFSKRGALAVASWSDSAHRFIMVSHAGVDAMKRLL